LQEIKYIEGLNPSVDPKAQNSRTSFVVVAPTGKLCLYPIFNRMLYWKCKS